MLRVWGEGGRNGRSESGRKLFMREGTGTLTPGKRRTFYAQTHVGLNFGP